MQKRLLVFVLAGGVGSRYGNGSPKQLAPLAGYPIMHHTLRRFDLPELVDRVVVASNPFWHAEIAEICEGAVRKVPFEIVDGASSRNGSVRNCVIASPEADARVLVHDAVRPLVSRELIERVAAALTETSCVIPIVPSVDPIVHVSGDLAIGFGDRRTLYRGQSPQGFWLSELRLALDGSASADGAERWSQLDTLYEAMLLVRPDLPIRCVEGDLNNLKVTMQVDRMLAGRLLLEET